VGVNLDLNLSWYPSTAERRTARRRITTRSIRTQLPVLTDPRPSHATGFRAPEGIELRTRVLCSCTQIKLSKSELHVEAGGDMQETSDRRGDRRSFRELAAGSGYRGGTGGGDGPLFQGETGDGPRHLKFWWGNCI
jgi:hypothetical protein